MRALNGAGRFVSSLALWMGIAAGLASFPLSSSAALSHCEQLQKLANYFGDGVAFSRTREFAASEKWFKLLQGSDNPWLHHVLMSEENLYRKMELTRDRTLGVRTRRRDLDSASTRFLSKEIAKEMLIEGFKRVDALSAGKKFSPTDHIKLISDREDPTKQLLRISFDVDQPIGMGFVLGKDRFSDPVRVDEIRRVTLVVRKTRDSANPKQSFYHVMTFYPDALH